MSNPLGKLEWLVPGKRAKNKAVFCISSNKFFMKDGLQESNFVGNSLIKPADTVVTQKRNSMRKVNNESSENFEIKYLDECALYEVLLFT